VRDEFSGTGENPLSGKIEEVDTAPDFTLKA
jgi:hypothetical protein